MVSGWSMIILHSSMESLRSAKYNEHTRNSKLLWLTSLARYCFRCDGNFASDRSKSRSPQDNPPAVRTISALYTDYPAIQRRSLYTRNSKNELARKLMSGKSYLATTNYIAHGVRSLLCPGSFNNPEAIRPSIILASALLLCRRTVGCAAWCNPWGVCNKW